MKLRTWLAIASLILFTFLLVGGTLLGIHINAQQAEHRRNDRINRENADLCDNVGPKASKYGCAALGGQS